MEFTVVNLPMAYNVILGRPSLNAARAVVSTYHLKMKFPTGYGVGEVCRDQAAARVCSVQAAKAKQIFQVDDLDIHGEDRDDRIKPSTEIVPFELVPRNHEKVTYIGADLPE